jgi:hypothetical protein
MGVLPVAKPSKASGFRMTSWMMRSATKAQLWL